MRLAALLILLAACTGPYPSDIIRDPAFRAYPEGGTTYLVFDPSQGYRVEYFARDGTARLWVPHAAVIAGLWRIEDRHRLRNMGAYMVAAGEMLCLHFGARRVETLGPGDWDCRPRLRAADAVVAGLDGDVFGLAERRSPPFPLERCRAPPVFGTDALPAC